MTHLIHNNYGQFVHEVAKNNLERDGSNWAYVANHVIFAPTYMDGDIVVEFSAGPYYDGDRVYPGDVIRGADTRGRYPFDPPKETLRDIAVELLAEDLRQEAERIRANE